MMMHFVLVVIAVCMLILVFVSFKGLLVLLVDLCIRKCALKTNYIEQLLSALSLIFLKANNFSRMLTLCSSTVKVIH